MTKYVMIISLLLVSGCGPEDPLSRQETQIEDEFNPFVTKFLEEARAHGLRASSKGLIVLKASLEDHVLGSCDPNKRTVLINVKFWNHQYFGDSSKEQLMFHELGHCLLLRGHRAEKMLTITNNPKEIPVSIMNPQFFSHNFYRANYSYYLEELFDSHTPPLELAETSGNDGFDYAYYESFSATAKASLIDSGEEFDFSDFSCGHH